MQMQCIPGRVWITGHQFDYYKSCEQALKAVDPEQADALRKWLVERCTVAETVVDCATGRPYQPLPRRRPAQQAPYGVRPGEVVDADPPAWVSALAIEAPAQPAEMPRREPVRKPRKVTSKPNRKQQRATGRILVDNWPAKVEVKR